MSEQQIPLQPNPIADDEIDLIALAKTFWSGRRTIIKSILICGILGFLNAITSPKEFKATMIMVPSGGSGGSNLGGLAVLAGINLNANAGGDLSPNIYPQILSSLPYQLELMKTPLNFSGLSEPVTLIDYYTEIQKPNLLRKYTIGLPGVILGLPGAILAAIKGEEKKNIETLEKKKPFELTGKQQSGRSILSGLISLTVNAKVGTITLTAKMPEALAAAQLGQRAQELLQQHITEFKIKKTKENLDFIQERYNETKAEFEKAQVNLAIVTDRNKNFTSVLPRIEIDRIQTRYTITFNVFQDLAKQIEQAKIQVKQDTPVFTIIEPISVPTTRSNNNQLKILLIWLFLGGVLGTGIVFGREFIGSIKKRWNEE